MSKGILIVKDPEVAKLFADETRRRILHMLRHNEMSITDLAKALDKNHSSILHHINLLKEAELVKETRTEKVRNMVQPYYKATAYRYIISYNLSETFARDEGFQSWKEENLQGIFDGIKNAGFYIADDKKVRVAELMDSCNDIEHRALEDSIEKLGDLKTDKHVFRDLVQIFTHIELSKNVIYASAMRELGDLIGLKEN